MQDNEWQSSFGDGLREWSLQSNEGSGWTRLVAPILLWLGAWRRSLRQIITVGAFVAVSPYLFTESGEDTWMNRAIIGERLWIKRGRKDLGTLLSAGGAAAIVLSLFFALTRKFFPSVFFLIAGWALSAWHLDRMAAMYDHARATGQDVPEPDDEILGMQSSTGEHQS